MNISKTIHFERKKFAEKENANKYIVSLIALLHDADDYKLFGRENAEKLTNAKIIMDDIFK